MCELLIRNRLANFHAPRRLEHFAAERRQRSRVDDFNVSEVVRLSLTKRSQAANKFGMPVAETHFMRSECELLLNRMADIFFANVPDPYRAEKSTLPQEA